MDFTNPLMVPIVGAISGTAMVVLIVAIVFWYKARAQELQFHQQMRLREMEHQKRMKEIELEIERTRARGQQAPEGVGG